MKTSSKGSIQDILGHIVTHDDKLILRGQKCDVGIDPEWWRRVPSTGEILGYFNPETEESIGPDEKPPKGFKAIQKRALPLDNDIMLSAEQSFFDIRMLNLWGDLRSRYRKGLEAVEQASRKNIITYTGSDTTPKHRTEAIRNRVKRHWRVALYEHDLVILDEHIGREMMRELRPHDKGRDYEHTIYLKGFKGTKRKDKPLLVKVYDMEPKHGVKGWKLEVSYRNEYIKRHEIRGPEAWLTQPDIQSMLRKSLIREWKGVFEMAPSTKGMLAEALEVKQTDLFDFVANTEHTLTDLTQRVARLEEKQAETDKILEEIQADRKREW